MSTLSYAQLTNLRDVAPPNTSTTASKPGVQTYMDTFAALVPAEVLTLHALIIAATTKIGDAANAAAGKATTAATVILPEALDTLHCSFWGLFAMALALFAVPRYMGGRWDRFDWIRMLIAPLAFVGWTMLQRTTAFDAAFPALQQAPRTVFALFLGAILGAVTALLALEADAKPVPEDPA